MSFHECFLLYYLSSLFLKFKKREAKKDKAPPMFILILLLFIPLSFFLLESTVMIFFSNYIGVPKMLFCLLATTLTGAFLLKKNFFPKIIDVVNKNRQYEDTLPALSMISRSFLIIAGFLLLIPGFITDAAGALLLFPPVRHFLVSRILKSSLFFFTDIRYYPYDDTSSSSSPDEHKILEGEIINENSTDTPAHLRDKKSLKSS